MSDELSSFAKRLLSAGRADLDADHVALERELLTRLSRDGSGKDPTSARKLDRRLTGWTAAGVAVGIGVLALYFVWDPPASPPQSEVVTQRVTRLTEGVATADVPASPPVVEPSPAVSPESLPPAPPSSRRGTVPAESSDLLREANQLRAQSRWADAAKKYEQVLRQRGNSPEAYPATIALAKLALDHLGDPARALSLYDRAMAMTPDGSLAEATYWGRARALRALDRRDDERHALHTFMTKYPSSLLAGSAAARLKQLEAN